MPTDFLEKTLEDIIYNNRTKIHERGLSKIKNNAYRQVILPSGKKIDILGFEIHNGILYCDIYELKREVIDADAICQAFNYYTELKFITSSHFSKISCKLIMIGKKYEPVSVIDALPIPVDVFIYEYYMDGIQFREIKDHYLYSQPHPSFCFGLWAFGHGEIFFKEDVSSIRFHATYDDFSKNKPEFTSKIKGFIEYYVTDTKLIENKEVKYVENKDVKEKSFTGIVTEVFPPQPSWTFDFAKDIPSEISIMEELGEEWEDDLEYDDECETDSDFEIDSDFEQEFEEEDDPLLINESEYRRSVYINSLSIIKIL